MTAQPPARDGPGGVGSVPSSGGSVQELTGALAGVPTLGAGPWVHFRPPRIRSRSTVLFIESSAPVAGYSRLVVKQAHPDSSQGDVASPLAPSQEFAALERLHLHFQRGGGPARVPEPVALLPGARALAMEYVSGRSLDALLRYRGLRPPTDVFNALAAAADFLRQLHDLEVFPTQAVDLRNEAAAVLAMAEDKLRPVGLEFPRQVTRILERVPPVGVDSRQVWLHGDFVPANVILTEDGSTVGLDSALDTVGSPEVDLARFTAVMSGALRFSPEVVAPPVTWVRRRLERQLLSGYYGTRSYPPLFELRLIDQLARRWLRWHELAEHWRRSTLPLRLRVVKAQTHLLMQDSASRLVRSLEL